MELCSSFWTESQWFFKIFLAALGLHCFAQAFSSCGGGASHWSGFSYCRTWALDFRASNWTPVMLVSSWVCTSHLLLINRMWQRGWGSPSLQKSVTSWAQPLWYLLPACSDEASCHDLWATLWRGPDGKELASNQWETEALIGNETLSPTSCEKHSPANTYVSELRSRSFLMEPSDEAAALVNILTAALWETLVPDPQKL